jgi:putative DNA primase/helicase
LLQRLSNWEHGRLSDEPSPEQIREAAHNFARNAEIANADEKALHTYTDASGNPLYWRIRLKNTATGEKWMRPFHFDGQEFVLREPPAPETGKPLYALHLLALHPDALVLIVEGEKAADALNKAFKKWNVESQYVATTSGGAGSAASADWTPLAGRRTVISPDNDDAGKKYASDVAAVLQHKAASVMLLDPAALNLPKGGDAFDWLQRDDASASSLMLLLDSSCLDPFESISGDSQSPDSILPGATQKNVEKELQDEITRLLSLSPLEYERTYKEVAKTLGMRPLVLDREVKAARSRKAEESGTGEMFPEVEPWDSPVDAGEILSGLAEAFRRYAVLPPHAAEALALWCAFTWFCEASHIAPLLVLRSPEKGCGKSTVLGIIARLVCRPLPVSGITAAVLFRMADRYRPTVLIDEGDTFLNSKNQEMHGILNCGHSRHAPYIWRCAGDDHELQRFNVFGPKAIALIGHTRDTLHDRAVEVELVRKLPHEKVSRLRNGDGSELEELARKLARLAMDHTNDFAEMKPNVPESLPDRQADNWEPLLAIAMLAGDDWLRKATEAAVALTKSKEQSAPMSVGVELLRDCYEIIKTRGWRRFWDEELLEELRDHPEADWGIYNRGKPITRKQLRDLLAKFGITKKSVRGGNKVCRGFKIEEFEEAFSRYCASIPEDAAENVTTLQPATGAASHVTDGEIVTVTQVPSVTSKPNTDADCNNVTEISEGKTKPVQNPSRGSSLRI